MKSFNLAKKIYILDSDLYLHISEIFFSIKKINYLPILWVGLRILKCYSVLEKLSLNVDIKAFWYT